MRALVISSKILQAMGNEVEFSDEKDKSMMICNRFVRKNMPQWRAFFHKLMVSSRRIVREEERVAGELDEKRDGRRRERRRDDENREEVK